MKPTKPTKFLYRPPYSKRVVERQCFCGSTNPESCICGTEMSQDMEAKPSPDCSKKQCSGARVRPMYGRYSVECECRARENIALITGITVSGET